MARTLQAVGLDEVAKGSGWIARAQRLVDDEGKYCVERGYLRLSLVFRLTAAGDYYQTFLLTIATLVRSVVLDPGRLTADEFDSYARALRQHLEDPQTRTCQPLMWQAWGRKARVRGF